MMSKPELARGRPDKCSQLRSLLQSPTLDFILEAHNGLSARIVEQAGFRGIWASGLALSAQFGVRDSNEASWTQVVEMLEFMSDVTNIPILLDGDTGYGNFNNMRRLVRKLEQRNIAGVCIEDKQFPKTNSFIDGERQPLADIDEFCGKIKAGKDVQQNNNFNIVARVEAFIAGWGLNEALERAEAYREAGADAILIHSKLARADEILEFAGEWAGRHPLVIVPTKYYSTPTEVFRKAGINLAIWANHMIRASIMAMQRVSEQIMADGSIANVEHQIAAVNEIFALQGVDELSRAQARYLKPKQSASAIILAASRGKQLYELTEHRPKVMLPVSGKPLLRWLVDEFKHQSVDTITVVAGYKAESIDVSGIDIRINEKYDTTGELHSLACARDQIGDNSIIIYGDLLIRGYILRDLLEADGEIIAVVDSALDLSRISGTPDYAYCSSPDDRSVFRPRVELRRISESAVDPGLAEPSGRWIGMLRICGRGVEAVQDALEILKKQAGFHELAIPDLLNHLIANGITVNVHYIHGHWLDVNSLDDLGPAGDFTSS